MLMFDTRYDYVNIKDQSLHYRIKIYIKDAFEKGYRF